MFFNKYNVHKISLLLLYFLAENIIAQIILLCLFIYYFIYNTIYITKIIL